MFCHSCQLPDRIKRSQIHLNTKMVAFEVQCVKNTEKLLSFLPSCCLYDKAALHCTVQGCFDRLGVVQQYLLSLSKV